MMNKFDAAVKVLTGAGWTVTPPETVADLPRDTTEAEAVKAEHARMAVALGAPCSCRICRDSTIPTKPTYDPPDSLTSAVRAHHLDLMRGKTGWLEWDELKPEQQQKWRETVAAASAPYREELRDVKKALNEAHEAAVVGNNEIWSRWVKETNTIREILGVPGNVTPVDAVTKLKAERDKINENYTSLVDLLLPHLQAAQAKAARAALRGK